MKRLIFPLCLLFVLLTFCAVRAVPTRCRSAIPALSEFQNVPMEFRPWAYYWWLKGNVTKESITADLTRMKELGFGGVLVFDSRGYHEDAEQHIPVPVPIRHEFMSPGWQDLIIHLVQEADRLDLKVSLNLSNTGGHLRGSWDFGADGPRSLFVSAVSLPADRSVSVSLAPPSCYRFFRDEILLAVQTDSPLTDDEEFTVWRQPAPPEEGAPAVLKVIDLSDKLGSEQLEWTPPTGGKGWSLLRFGSAVIGDVGSIDILNARVVADYYGKMAGTLLNRLAEIPDKNGVHSLAGGTLTGFYNVSWEGASPNWTERFDRFFEETRGYSLRPYLPVLAGVTVESPEMSRRFLTDFHKTIADAFCRNCYREIGTLCHRDGIFWHSEDGGPWNRQSPLFSEGDMLAFWGQNDAAQGEFWMQERFEPTRQTNTKFAASASHIYGHPTVALESFTHMTRHWTMYPALLKPSADQNFIDGGNLLIWHTYTAPVPGVGKPGYEYFAGTHINSNVTWQRDAAPFVEYIGRCQTLLRSGGYAADFAVYTSDRNYRMWGRGEKWSEKSGWGAPAGTAYDLFDTNALLTRLEWKNGAFTLPDGTAYSWLVFDPEEEEIPLAALEKIVQLAESGGKVILGPYPPKRTRGLSDGPEGDARAAELAARLWGDESLSVRQFGRGVLYTGLTPKEVMERESAQPDFSGSFEYHHRKYEDGDVYFLVNRSGETVSETCRFRTQRSSLSFWDPVSGDAVPAELNRGEETETADVTLPPYGSVFAVFTDMVPDGAVKNDPPVSVSQDEVSGPWRVRFNLKNGGFVEENWTDLKPWNEDENPEIRYFSGTACYETSFSLSSEDLNANHLFLDIGKAAVIACVRLNGTDAGVLWTSPWRLDLRREPLKNVLHEGENRLEIEVTNCWANRLIGDALLPPEQRETETNLQFFPENQKFNPWQGYAAGEQLRESGLLGPVKLIRAE